MDPAAIGSRGWRGLCRHFRAERGLFRLYPGQAKKIARVLDLDPDELLEEVPNDG